MAKEIEIAVEIVYMTASAVRVYDGLQEVWLPLSVIKDYTGEMSVGESITICLSEYWAEKKGLI